MRQSLAISFILLGCFTGTTAWGACSKASSISPTSISTSLNTSKVQLFTVSGSTGPYEISVTPATNPAHGTLAIAANGTITYTPSAGYSGADSFKVRTFPTCDTTKTKDFTVNVTIAGCTVPITMNSVPALSVVAGNTLTWSPSGALATGGSGTLTYGATILTSSTDAGILNLASATGGFTYTPGATFSGTYSFNLTASDSGACTASQTVNIDVVAPTVCAAPFLPNFSVSTLIDTATTRTPTISGGMAPYAYSIGLLPGHGTLTLNDTATGNYTYTPATGYTGSDTFSLSAASTCTDSSVSPAIVNPGTTATATVTVGALPSVCTAPRISAVDLIVPSGQAFITATPTVSGGTPPYVYSVSSVATTLHGTVTINSSTGLITYTPTTGYVGNAQFDLTVASSCGTNPSSSKVATVVVESTNSTGTIGAATGGVVSGGAIIIDNTANPGTPGIVTNMSTVVGGKNFGLGNAFSIAGVQVMQRDTTTDPTKHLLFDEIGVTNTKSTSYQNYGTTRQTTYFANGQHLFDLDRMRKTANWMRTPSGVTVPDAATLNGTVGTNQIPATASPPATCNTYATVTSAPNSPSTPIGLPVGSCHPAGTFGTITWAEFLDNIKNNRTMYGVVRILVPLKLGATTSTNNALNATVGSANIYGFCNVTTEWCANSPTGSTDIKPGAAVAGNNSVAVTIPTTGQLKVRGTLMFDFVNGTTDAVYGTPGHPIGLDHLPYNPRDIYFKVSVAINVNAANDKDGNGILDNADYINGITKNITCPSYPCTTLIPADGTGNSPAMLNTEVPQDSIDAYNQQYGTGYLSNTDPAFVTMFNALNKPSQYHMLMASGYAQGWKDAFAELNVTGNQWESMGYLVPDDAVLTAPLTISNIRNSQFEDIPVYLYTGGLVDMHHHMNVSGLIYVPQSAEIEAKMNDAANPTRMYMMGGLIVRDGFYLEGKPNAMILISSDPSSFASLRVLSSAIQGAMMTSALSTAHDSSAGAASPYGVGLPSGGSSGSGSNSADMCVGCGGGSGTVSKTRWIEIRPK